MASSMEVPPRDLQKAVRQLLSSVISPTNGSQSKVLSLEDAVANLETTDENFHSYDIVKYVHGQIESVINPLVDDRLKRQGLSHGEEHDIVALITDDILTSPEYNELCQSILSEVKDSVDHLLQSDIEFDINDLSSNHTSLSGGSSRTQYYPLDDSVTSELSSLKETGLFFIPPDQLLDITDELKPIRSVEVRLEALQQLHQFPPGDLPQCDTWSSLSSSLEDCLMSDCNALADSALKLLSRMFDSTTSYKAGEVYRILMGSLINHFRGPGKANIEAGLDPSTGTNTKLLQRFRMMHHIQVELPSYWLRYNERVIEDVMNLTLSLLELSYEGGGGGESECAKTPLHYMCVIDPSAHWFYKWMHTQYSRVKMINSLKRSHITLKGLLQHLIMKGFKNEEREKGRGVGGVGEKKTSSNILGHVSAVYSPAGLSYLHSLHALHVVGQLLLYSQGRDIIAAALRQQECHSINNINLLIQHLMELLLNWSASVQKPTMSCDNHVNSLDPTVPLHSLFAELASRNQLSSSLLCQDNIMEVILLHLNNSTQTKVNLSLVNIINNSLAVLASTCNGRQYLLKVSAKKNESAADTIAQFVVKSLNSGHAHNSSNSDLVYSCLLVCRQLYSTSDGVLALLPYDLHLHIARAVQGMGGARGGANNEETLRTRLIDTLLNFAGTPKGIELLNGSGLIAECISHMRHRYQLKLQVSQCEKFGYGYMVSEVASTTTGITHLINSGYVCDLVQDLWSLLNGSMACDDEDIKRDPFDPSDRALYKSTINILNVISSFPAFHKTLLTEAPPKTTPTNIVTVRGLLESLVLIYGPMSGMNTNDEAHLCGLRIISILSTSLDSFVLLETLHNLRSVLVSYQEVCKLDNNQYIIDACSIERNRLLVSSSCIGGPNERVLPPHTLTKISDVYKWPFYTNLKEKVPDCYRSNLSYLHHKSTLTIKSSNNINDLKLLYFNHLKTHKTLSTRDVCMLLLQTVTHLEQVLPQVKESTAVGDSPSPEQDIMINLITMYSRQIGITNVSKDSLRQILQKFNSVSSDPHNSAPSSDWFSAIVSLVLLQSHDQSCDTVRQFLRRFSTCVASLYVWRQRENLQPLLGFDTNRFHTLVLHYIELIIQAELPLVYSAFRLSGYTPSQVCQDWLRQCFLNYLDWPEICLYLINCILLGVDYQVYFCVAIFKHLEADILKACQEHTLLIFLKEEPLRGYTTQHSLPFMYQLEEKYRSNILKDLQAIQP